MKVIDARSGKLQNIPFSLGESGRGRWLEEVKISNRPGQVPDGPEDVGYFVFGQDRKHVILAKASTSQHGILLRINTEGTYTRGSSGSVSLLGGNAKLLTSGEYAFGEAGNCGGGTDELWHVESPAIFAVVICGGSHKGYGHRYLVVAELLNTRMLNRDELCQLIATDEDPEIISVARLYQDSLHEDVKAAFRVADELENAEVAIVATTHFFIHEPMEEVVTSHGFAVPASLRLSDGSLGGVSSIQSGTLMPGDKALVAFSIARLGGKRYRAEVEAEIGLTRLHVSRDFRGVEGNVLALVEQPDWHVIIRHFKDGEEYCLIRYDAGGCHRYGLPEMTLWQTIPWAGREAISPPTLMKEAKKPEDGIVAAAFRKAGL